MNGLCPSTDGLPARTAFVSTTIPAKRTPQAITHPNAVLTTEPRWCLRHNTGALKGCVFLSRRQGVIWRQGLGGDRVHATHAVDDAAILRDAQRGCDQPDGVGFVDQQRAI